LPAIWERAFCAPNVLKIDIFVISSYKISMDLEMIRKIDAVLEKVKEPESGLSIAQLGLVERLRYSERYKKLYVFTRPIASPPGCCIIIAKLLQSTTGERLKSEFQKEFPDLSIEFV
jgi:metal-sulfur cluster biosynthetic enzyme